MYTGNEGARAYHESAVGLPTEGVNQSPFYKVGEYAMGVNVPQVLPGINSPQQLMELLEIAQEVQAYGGIKNVLEENEVLRAAEVERQNNQAVTCEEEPIQLDPSFPRDFTDHGDYHLFVPESNYETQESIRVARSNPMDEGDTVIVTSGNTAVVVSIIDGKRITLVAPNFYEHVEPFNKTHNVEADWPSPEPAMVDPNTNNVSVQIGHAGAVLDAHELVAKIVEGLTNGRRVSL